MTNPVNWLRPDTYRVVSSRGLGWQTTERLSPLRPDVRTEHDAAYSVTTPLRPDFATPIVVNTLVSPGLARSPRSTILNRQAGVPPQVSMTQGSIRSRPRRLKSSVFRVARVARCHLQIAAI